MRRQVLSVAVAMLTIVAVSGVLQVSIAAQTGGMQTTGQQQKPPAKPKETTQKPKTTAPATNPAPGEAPTPSDYIIGPDDILTIFAWKEKDFSGDFVVRPDGKITMPLLNDIQAAGLTTDALRKVIAKGVVKYVPELPEESVTVVVKQINSRKVFITGMVNRPGTYPLSGPMTVLQLIALAGGLQEFADEQHIIVVRATEKGPDGQPVSYVVNYKQLKKRQNLKQNIELKPGDTIIVS